MTLDDLARMDIERLHALYLEGQVPRMEELDGRLRGRLLAVAAPERARGLADTVVRRLALSKAMIWKGKSFRPTSATTAEGFNLLLSLDSDHKVAPFHARVAPSQSDGRPAVELDYDRRDNPLPVRTIRDELRRVGSSLYLGQAWLRAGSTLRMLFYVGLER
jgi:hypothetical protein